MDLSTYSSFSQHIEDVQHRHTLNSIMPIRDSIAKPLFEASSKEFHESETRKSSGRQNKKNESEEDKGQENDSKALNVRSIQHHIKTIPLIVDDDSDFEA
mmetsp:Transcript_15506/g.17229  ORF Transcript_15506/g.17229 Transcript_15506/m.17229 type:complete len:100 (+) Transcript_15506:522-821(+)